MEQQSSRRRSKPSSPGADETRKRSSWAKGEWWEWIAIFFAILALWPKILRWHGFVWDIVLWAMLALMVVVFVRRTRRMRRRWRDE